MNIAAYCRVSTDKADQLGSLEAQKGFFVEYAQRTGHTLVRLYADEGLSGTKVRRRVQFQQMMADAERGLFQMLVVKDISRLARNTVDLLQSVRRLKALGIQTLFLTAGMDSLGESEFVLTLFGALAQEESANMSKRIKFGKRVNAQRGKVPNLVYGYRKSPGDCFHLTVDREEAEAVRQMYRWYIQDGWGAGKIAAELSRRGLRTRQGRPWSANGVSRILQNPLYTGRVVNGKQEVADFLTSERRDLPREDWLIAERPELRIVSDEDFRAAQALRAGRAKALRAGRRHSSSHLFSTLIRCKACGWSFRRTSRTYRNTYVRWVCSRRNGQGADQCGNAASVDEEALMDALDAHFRALLGDRERVKARLRQALRRAGGGGAEEGRRLREKRKRLERTRQKYLDLFAEDVITRQELEEKLTGTRRELEAVQARLEALEASAAGGERLEAVLEDVQDLLTVRSLSNGQMRQLVERIEVDSGGAVEIYLGGGNT